MYLLFHPLHVPACGLTRSLLNAGSESQRDVFPAFVADGLRGVARVVALWREAAEVLAWRPSVRSCVKWPAISKPLRGPDGLYQVPIQLMAPDMAKEASLASQGAMDLSAIPSSM